MQELPDNNELTQNERGHYSHSQVRSLILWFLRYVPLLTLGGFGLAFSLPNSWRIITIIATIVMLTTYLWLYSADLVHRVPASASGIITKEVRRFRGPTRYDVLIGQGALRVRALNKMQWQGMQDGITYKIYYSPRTKWLLSFKQLTNE